jgi:hypothetical protein
MTKISKIASGKRKMYKKDEKENGRSEKGGGEKMRMKIRAEKNENGKYVMVARGQGKIEYPQEGAEHKTKSSVYDAAQSMYAGSVWAYNRRLHTIKID